MAFLSARHIVDSARRRLRRLAANVRGSAAIEFAALAPLIIALTVGGMQVGAIYFAQTELARITNAASRNVMLGGAINQTAAQFQSSLCANLAAIFSCSGLMVSLTPQPSYSSIGTTPPTLTFDSHGAVTNVFPYDPGTYGDIMVLQVMYLLPVVSGPLFKFSTSSGQVFLVSTIVFKNEPQ